MSPKVIADSDDEISENGFPFATTTSPAKHAGDMISVTMSTSHRTASTDPAFFEAVFNEQNAAAQVENGTEASIQNKNKEEDPWEIPSSPDAPRAVHTPGRRNAEGNTRTKVTRRMRQQLEEIGYASDEEGDPGRSNSDRKRRKTASRKICSDDEDASLLIAPATLSASQKKHYQSAILSTSSSVDQPLEQKPLNVVSSGTSTNLNTPRTAKSASLNLSGNTIVDENACSRSLQRSRRRSKGDFENETSPTEDVDYEAPGDDFTDDANAKREEQAPKKTRGRPKKKGGTTLTGGKSPPKPKRKRGRPKKAEAELEEPRLDDPTRTETKPEQHLDTEADKEHLEVIPEVQNVKLATQVKDERHQQSSHDGGTPNDAQQPVRIVEESAPATKVSFIPASTASAIARPLYRVGLSKRTRIAPLLKSVPK